MGGFGFGLAGTHWSVWEKKECHLGPMASMCPLTVTFLLVHPILKNAHPMYTCMCWGAWLREGSEDKGVADGSSGSRKRERGGLA